ncbi:hypothetical protein EV688_101388 [Chromatocurvus halotolerans]|uniref:Uncharacterized protein n=1 Tax=Chromatocurvus halotolerans TaxID=1132028 RepID=A0A4V2SCA1_9GAMM|nr:hypothetical protein EV688_101388 [Chromatocurvus halotolerans]
MFWLQGFRFQSAVTQGVKLIREKRQHPLAVLLGGVSAIVIMATELFELIVQVLHRV